MKIALASDHAGYSLKTSVAGWLSARGHETVDYGMYSEDPVDYPDFVRPAAEAVARGDCTLGIVFGGSGNGEAMAANRVNYLLKLGLVSVFVRRLKFTVTRRSKVATLCTGFSPLFETRWRGAVLPPP